VRSALGPGREATLESSDVTALLVDGVSCKMQLDQLSEIRSTALISLVRRTLRC
jgi:hypothetical protein